MTTLFYYLLKVAICSGLLFFYYQVALKNKLFHQWNRFYLLSSVALSLLLPLVHFQLFDDGRDDNKAIQLLQVVQSADHYLEEFTISNKQAFSPERWAVIGYAFVSFVLLLSLAYSLLKIVAIIKRHSRQWMHTICLISTREPGTPFSFFQYIFWNEDISLKTETGQQIFQHELVHVQEKHTLDKLFMQVILIFFWCNPFFWLMRRELKYIHEFIADKKSVSAGGTAAFAAMLLQSAYPQHYHFITNPFFQTSIKRRLFMLTKIHNPRKAYLSRIIVLPLIASIAFAFTVRTRTNDPRSIYLQKEIVVVIDPGHGEKNGVGTGSKFEKISEDAIVLQLARKIQAMNTNKNLRIVLTRRDENLASLPDRVLLAKNEKADVFISLHTNAGEKNKEDVSGIQIYIPSKNEAFDKQSQLLGSAMEAELSKVYKTNPQLLKQEAGIYVLNNAPAAALLIECGSITVQKDREFISNEKNQEVIARSILDAVQHYAASNETSVRSISTNSREIAAVDVNTGKKELTISYTDGSSETVTEPEAQRRGLLNNDYSLMKKSTVTKQQQDLVVTKEPASRRMANDTTPSPIYIVDGKEISSSILSQINPKNISSVNVLKGESAITKYGDKGKNGVVEITMKSTSLENETDKTTVIQTSNYKGKAYYIVKTNGVIKSIDVDGRPVNQSEFPSYQTTISEIQRINNEHLKNATKDVQLSMEKQQEQALSNYQNEKGIVNSEPNFTQTEVEASVDPEEWKAFLIKYTTPILNEISKNVKPGNYTAYVRFLVTKDGTLSDFQLVKDPGYDIGTKLLKVMPYAPKWKPAMQNGKPVRVYHTQPITFNISN